MDLTYDWRSFQSMFYPKRRSARSESFGLGPVYLVMDGETVVSAFSEGEDLSDWVGAHYERVRAEFVHRELVAFDYAQVNDWLEDSLSLPHFHDQINFLREKATPGNSVQMGTGAVSASRGLVRFAKSTPAPLFRRHFILEAIQGWWAKLLPSAYGIFIRLEGEAGHPSVEDIFVLVRRGRLESFHKADLSTMRPDKRRVSLEVIRFLSSRHSVPVQGLFLKASEWQQWSESPNPWRALAQAIRTDRARVVPFRWSLVTLAASRAFFGI